MKEVLLLCLMVLVIMGNNSGRWTKKTEEDPKDLKDKKENMKEVFAHWQEYISNKIYTTTTSTSTMPPTTSTSTMPPTTTTNNNKEFIEAIEELKDEMKEVKGEIKEELKDEMKEIKGEMTKEIKEELKKNSQDMLKKMREWRPESTPYPWGK